MPDLIRLFGVCVTNLLFIKLLLLLSSFFSSSFVSMIDKVKSSGICNKQIGFFILSQLNLNDNVIVY